MPCDGVCECMHVLPALDIAQVVTPTEVDSEEPDAECRLG